MRSGIRKKIEELVRPYEPEEKPYVYGILSAKKAERISFSGDVTEEMFGDIFGKMREKFGTPVYVHGCYGFLWKTDGKYISFGFVEESYCCPVLNIIVFDGLPHGKKLAYEKYAATDAAVKTVFESLGFCFEEKYFIRFCRIGFLYIVSKEDVGCVLMIKKNGKMTAYISDFLVTDDGKKRTVFREKIKKSVNTEDSEQIKKVLTNILETK